MVTAHDYFERCLNLCEAHDLKAVAAANLFMLGAVRIYQNENRQALLDVERSVKTAQLVGHKRAEIVSRLTVAYIKLEGFRLGEARPHIEKSLAMADDIGAKRFVPYAMEAQSRHLFLLGRRGEALDCLDRAIERVRFLSAESFIGPWLLGTRALFSESRREMQRFLDEGETWLKAGCIGHNYLRFYIAAIECALNAEDELLARHFISRLEAYTREEPCLWSEFYLRRARALLVSGDDQVNRDKVVELIREAESAQMLTAVPKLREKCHIFV